MFRYWRMFIRKSCNNFVLITLGDRVCEIKNTNEKVLACQDKHWEVLRDHSDHIQDLMLYVDDLENRNRQNNIHIRGVPESVSVEVLQATVKGIINVALDRSPEADLGLEKMHSFLGTLRPGSERKILYVD